MMYSELREVFGKRLISNGSLIKFGLFLPLILASTVLPQETDIFPVPDSYRIEGIPPIRKSEVKNLFYDPSAIKSNLIWDIDRKNKRLLVTDETNNVYLLDSPLSKPVKLFDKIIPNSIKVRADGSSFAFNSDHEDQDNYQLYLYSFKNKSINKLVTLTGKDESIDSFNWDKKGDSLFYTRIDYDQKTSKVCRFDFLKEKCFAVDLKGIWYVMDSDGARVLLKYWKASGNQQLFVFDINSGKLTAIEEQGNARKSFLTTDRMFWTSEGNENCTSEPCVLSRGLSNSDINQLKLPKDLININDMKISPKGNNILFHGTVNGMDYLRIFQLKNNQLGEEIPQFITGSYVIWNTRWFSDNEVVYTLENNGKPASIESFKMDSRKTTFWTEGRLPPQLKNKVKPPEVIKWKSFDGMEISGYIVGPKSVRKKSPVLIYVHGGPQIVDKPIFNLQDINLASNLGLNIIHTNIRGSSGFGKEFMDADNKERRADAVKDIRTLLDWIEKQPGLDATQIYLKGESYGGFIVLSTALQEPNRIKGVVAEYPLVSVSGLLFQNSTDEFVKNEYGDPADINLISMLDGLSPLNNSDKWNNIPLFMTRGKLDTRNPEKDVIELKNQLQQKGSEVWFIFSTDAGHGFGGEYVNAALFQFLKKQINKEYKEK